MAAIPALREIEQRKLALKRQSKLVPTSHGNLEYAEWGEGTPVLVLHGAGGGFDQGRLLAEALGPGNHRWIAISRFGYLRSGLPEDASPTAQADAVANLLAELKVEQVDILAMSGGTPPALKLAELFPEKVRRVALLSPAPFTPFGPDVDTRPMPTWLYSAMLGNDLVYWTLTRTAREQLANSFDARPELRKGLSAAEKTFIARLIDGFAPASARLAGINNEGAAVSPDQTYDLGSISAPTLIIHAADDRINPAECAEALAAQIPSSRHIVYPTGGHLLLGHHLEIKALLQQFLGS